MAYLNKRISPPCNIPSAGWLGHNRIASILLPGFAAIVRDDDALALSSFDVRQGPVCGEILDRSVEGDESTVLLSLEIHGLS